MRRALLLTTALLLTACGGGEDEKAAFVADATAVCERAATDSEALKSPAAPAEFAPYADGIVSIAKKAQADLAELALPEEDEADLRSKVLDPFADVVVAGEEFAKKVRAAGADQAKLLPLLSQVPDSGDVDLEYLRDYGLDTCADVISQE